MQQKELYFDLVAEEVEELASRVALVKKRFAKQKVGIKLEHLAKLAQVHTRCAAFNRCVEQFEEADEFQLEQNHAAVEAAWNESMDAVDMLLEALS
jgi:hypothetical protein